MSFPHFLSKDMMAIFSHSFYLHLFPHCFYLIVNSKIDNQIVICTFEKIMRAVFFVSFFCWYLINHLQNHHVCLLHCLKVDFSFILKGWWFGFVFGSSRSFCKWISRFFLFSFLYTKLYCNPTSKWGSYLIFISLNKFSDMQFSFFLFFGYIGVTLLSPVMHNLWIWRVSLSLSLSLFVCVCLCPYLFKENILCPPLSTHPSFIFKLINGDIVTWVDLWASREKVNLCNH
jgi:hypothetical protein